MRKLIASSLLAALWVIMITTSKAQSRPEIALSFTDSTTTPLQFIANQFYKSVNGLDSCCITAMGSAKFTVYSSRRIDDVLVSVGIPSYIANALKEAIYFSSSLWKLGDGHKPVSVIIPLFIAPSNLCSKDSIKDEIYTSSSNMFIYEGGNKSIKRHDYLKKASGSAHGYVLSPLLIKGKLNDAFK